MVLLFTALIIISCILLVIIILVQNPKGGGLSSSFGGGGTQLLGGVKKTTDFLDRGTWVLSIVLLGLVLTMSVTLGGGPAPEEQTSETVENADQFSAPASPALNNQQGLQIQESDLPESVEDEDE